jgi:hypothetical protein
MTAPRLVRDFPAPADPWPIGGPLASAQGYRQVGHAEARTYRRGAGFAVGFVWSRSASRRVGSPGAWVAANGLARLFSLHILPPEITVEPGGVKAILPRRMGQ